MFFWVSLPWIWIIFYYDFFPFTLHPDQSLPLPLYPWTLHVLGQRLLGSLAAYRYGCRQLNPTSVMRTENSTRMIWSLE